MLAGKLVPFNDSDSQSPTFAFLYRLKHHVKIEMKDIPP